MLDGGVIVLVSILSALGYRSWSGDSSVDISIFAGGGFLAFLLFYGVLKSRGQRVGALSTQVNMQLRNGLLSWVIAFGLFLLVTATMKMSPNLPLGGILAFFFSGTAAIALTRMKVPFISVRTAEKRVLDGQDAIVIGPRNDLEFSGLMAELRQTMRREPLPVVFDATCDGEAWLHEVQRTLSHVRRLARNAGPGRILILGHGLAQDRLEVLMSELTMLPRAICVIPDEPVAGLLSRRRTMVGDHVAVEVQPAPLNTAQRALKRALDILVASFLLVVLSPFLGAIALLIKCDSAGPVFFRQTRTGYRGHTFKIWKFRTMTVLEDGPVIAQAQKSDHRITRLGRILRRSSLDELPQLFNVVTGDMSLVGPRPHAVAHDKSYARQIPDYMLRQHILPGITGWAQVNGFRGETTSVDAMCRRVEHDIWYARNCCLFLDFKIMVRTFFEIVRARNAY